MTSTIVILSLVVPPTVTLMASPKITATRAVLLAFTIPAVLVMFRGITGGQRRLRLSDYTMAATCALMFIGFSVTEGIAVAAIPEIEELNIGHSIVSHALFVGMEAAVREMGERIRRARGREGA